MHEYYFLSLLCWGSCSSSELWATRLDVTTKKLELTGDHYLAKEVIFWPCKALAEETANPANFSPNFFCWSLQGTFTQSKKLAGSFVLNPYNEALSCLRSGCGAETRSYQLIAVKNENVLWDDFPRHLRKLHSLHPQASALQWSDQSPLHLAEPNCWGRKRNGRLGWLRKWPLSCRRRERNR